MCLIVVALESHPRYPLVLVANRDEFHSRPTAPAAFWADAPRVLAGRDLQAGGTWLGIARSGRLAAVTNYREPHEPRPGAPSRGDLTAGFLTGDLAPADYLHQVARDDDRYGGYNLICGDQAGLWYHSNRRPGVARVTPGIHGLSNSLLDTPWPKVVRARELLAGLLEQDELDPADLAAALGERQAFPDELLPDTGFGLERERWLSPLFIHAGGYGTRSTTAILLDRDGILSFHEQSFDATQQPAGVATYRIPLDTPEAP